ncbi:MAG: hypothetical protein Tsb0020_45910 [Haliangiales bacterium]
MVALAWLVGACAVPAHDDDVIDDVGTIAAELEHRGGVADIDRGVDSLAIASAEQSLCTATPEAVSCPHDTRDLRVSFLVTRDVHYQVPAGAPPADGWPVALLFQGSLFSAALTFEATDDFPFGGYYQALTVKHLLDAGYAVIAPEAHLEGATFWDTNVPPWNLLWSGSPDNRLMLALFNAIAAGDFGPLDATRLYATGISSGGYMTSRMAASYPGRFKALAVHSGSWATCSGPLCVIPSSLPDDHPPTMFLHGACDLTVPIWTMEMYYDDLIDQGHVATTVIDPDAGHEWIPASPTAIVDWFEAWP